MILAEWLTGAFGRGCAIPLSDVHERFLADRAWLAGRCAQVDAEVAAAEHDLAAALLRSWNGRAAEVELPAGTVRGLLAGTPTEPAALCNPDVMLGDVARSGPALAPDGWQDLHFGAALHGVLQLAVFFSARATTTGGDG